MNNNHLRHTICYSLDEMSTKDLSHKLVDAAIQLALTTVPGMEQTDKTSREVYKTLATEMLFMKARKTIKYIVPLNLQSCKRQPQQAV